MNDIYCDETIFLECIREQGKGPCQNLINLVSNNKLNGWISSQVKYELLRLGLAPHKITETTKSFAEVPLRSSITDLMMSHKSGIASLHILTAMQFGIKLIVTMALKRYENSVEVTAITPHEVTEKIGVNIEKTVPFLDIKAQHFAIYNKIDNSITDIISSGSFVLGKYVEQFEKEFAQAHNAKYCIGLSTGTDALHVAMTCIGVGVGDEVVVPVNTFIATAEGVSLVGATPVFVDSDKYYNMDTEALAHLLEKRFSKPGCRIKAIIPVHLYGQPAKMDEILRIAEKYKVIVIEDACQAHLASYKGVKVGNFGAMTAFSFYPGKNLGAYGEAGAIVTNNSELYKHAKMYRQHGEIERYHHEIIGHNYRMEAIQGAVLSAKMKYLPSWTEKRKKNARLYSDFLSGIPQVISPEELHGADCVYHLFVVQVERRDELRAYLEKHLISTGLHYPVPLHLQKAYSSLGYRKGDFPVAERVAGNMLSLPMFAELSEEQILYVCNTIRKFYTI